MRLVFSVRVGEDGSHFSEGVDGAAAGDLSTSWQVLCSMPTDRSGHEIYCSGSWGEGENRVPWQCGLGLARRPLKAAVPSQVDAAEGRPHLKLRSVL